MMTDGNGYAMTRCPARCAAIPLRLCLASALFGGVAQAQQSLEAPRGGAVFDEATAAIRLVIGVSPGGYLGPAVAGGLDRGAISPDGKLALAVKADTLRVLRIGEAQWVDLDADAGAVNAIVWSPDSDSAVVRGAGLRLWRKLGSAPERLDLPEVEGETWSALAVTPGGKSVLAGGRFDLYYLSSDGARRIAAVSAARAISLSAAGDEAFVADRERRQIFRVRDWSSYPVLSVVADGSTGVADPVALTVSPDGRTLLVANRRERSLALIDLRAQSARMIANLEFEPTRFERLPSGAHILTTRRTQAEPLFVLDPEMRGISFLPAVPLPQETSRRESGHAPASGLRRK
jgi:hypothetical protein